MTQTPLTPLRVLPMPITPTTLATMTPTRATTARPIRQQLYCTRIRRLGAAAATSTAAAATNYAVAIGDDYAVDDDDSENAKEYATLKADDNTSAEENDAEYDYEEEKEKKNNDGDGDAFVFSVLHILMKLSLNNFRKLETTSAENGETITNGNTGHRFMYSLVVLLELIGITSIVLVCVYAYKYMHGFSWNGNSKIFSWHPVFMTVGLVFLYGNGITFISLNNHPDILKTIHYIYIHTYIHTHIHNGWPGDFEDTRLLGKLATPVCRHLLRHICIVFTQHPQSQFVVHTVIIAEQTVITVSENECIYYCGQEFNKTGTLKPSVNRYTTVYLNLHTCPTKM